MQISIIPEPKKVIVHEENTGNAEIREKRRNPSMQEEEYRLQIQPEGVWIEGGSEKALLYAEATLEQIQLQCQKLLPCATVEDYPAYSWRSFHIDCARHFVPTEELKKMIRMCAHFKLNKFHWHFADDQGWRIECKRYPLLHEVGAVRKGDRMGCYHSEEIEDRYYTRAEAQEIVDFCGKLGIDVIPEVDMPGHVTAILAAYPQLGCTGKQIEVETKAGIFKDILCVGKEETFSFIENLLDDLLELFPGKYFHIGGDEVPKERWSSCPLCQKRMKDEGMADLQELQGYMENRIASYLKEKGRTSIVWNEAAYGGNLDPDTIIQLWTEDEDDQVGQHIKRGGKAIRSVVKHCYCDYPYGMTSLEDVYQLNLKKEEAGMPKNGTIGTECLAWAEHIRDAQKLEKLCWPRYAASAEVGWCGNKKPGYASFEKRMKILYPVFGKYGIRAAEMSEWVPSAEEAERQRVEFQKNFE